MPKAGTSPSTAEPSGSHSAGAGSWLPSHPPLPVLSLLPPLHQGTGGRWGTSQGSEQTLGLPRAASTEGPGLRCPARWRCGAAPSAGPGRAGPAAGWRRAAAEGALRGRVLRRAGGCSRGGRRGEGAVRCRRQKLLARRCFVASRGGFLNKIRALFSVRVCCYYGKLCCHLQATALKSQHLFQLPAFRRFPILSLQSQL